MPIFSRLGCRDVDDIMASFRWKYRSEIWCHSRQEHRSLVDLKLDVLDHDEPDVDEPFRWLVGHV